ncbi:MAG: tetratricopeptide repeat protein [Bacteroidetes bacterium]|nr:tetratricopeptide repeat protein [Bacteroidota bacterium]
MKKYYLCLIIMVVASIVRPVFAQTADELNKFRIAEALEQAGEYEKALGFYEQLHKIAPGNFVYFDGLKRIYMYLKKYPEVEELIQDRLKTEPNNVVLMCQLGDVFYKGGVSDSAMIEWNKAIQVNPKDPNVYRAVADVMVNNRLFDKAIEVYKKGEGITDSKAIFIKQIARLYFLNMNYSQSLREILELFRYENRPSAMAYIQSQLGSFSSSRDAVTQFTNEMEKEVKKNSDNVEYRQILAFLYMVQKDYSAAYDTYRWLDEHAGSHGDELLAFADQAYANGGYKPAAEAYREVVTVSKDGPFVPQALMGYARSLRALGEQVYTEDDHPYAINDTLKDLNASLAAYGRIIDEYPKSQYLTEAVLSSVEIDMEYFHDFNSAERLLSQYAGALSANPYEVILTRVELSIMEGKFADAVKDAQQAIQVSNEQNDRYYDRLEYQAGRALYYLGLYDSSKYYLNRVTSDPMSDAANEAIQLSNFIADNEGNPLALKSYAAADAMNVSNRIPEAAAQWEAILQEYPSVPLAENARFDLAGAYCKMGEVDKALKYYSELAQDSTGIFADRAQFRICRIYQETLHEKRKAIDEYESFLARFPNSILQDRVRAIIRALLGNNS